MSRWAHGLFVLVACGGCRQLFGIDETQVADDDVVADAPIDSANGGPDARPGTPDAPPDATPPDARACATTYPIAFGTHRYALGNNNLNWDTAEAGCEAEGGYLAIPDDLAENDFVRQLDAGNVWIGVTDRATEGVWLTIKGEQVPPHFENWGPNLPDGGNAEDCVQIPTSAGAADGDWDDGDCPNNKRPLCECEP